MKKTAIPNKPKIMSKQRALFSKGVMVDSIPEMDYLIRDRCIFINKELVATEMEDGEEEIYFYASIYYLNVRRSNGDPIGGFYIVSGLRFWRADNLRQVLEIVDAIKADYDLDEWNAKYKWNTRKK